MLEGDGVYVAAENAGNRVGGSKHVEALERRLKKSAATKARLENRVPAAANRPISQNLAKLDWRIEGADFAAVSQAA
ncbi:hypothetical protein GCM10022253_20450 [Sphingomonas endophytica]